MFMQGQANIYPELNVYFSASSGLNNMNKIYNNWSFLHMFAILSWHESM